jgi:hypothetical protein
MLAKEPEKRPTVAQILNLPLIRRVVQSIADREPLDGAPNANVAAESPATLSASSMCSTSTTQPSLPPPSTSNAGGATATASIPVGTRTAQAPHPAPAGLPPPAVPASGSSSPLMSVGTHPGVGLARVRRPHSGNAMREARGSREAVLASAAAAAAAANTAAPAGHLLREKGLQPQGAHAHHSMSDIAGLSTAAAQPLPLPVRSVSAAAAEGLGDHSRLSPVSSPVPGSGSRGSGSGISALVMLTPAQRMRARKLAAADEAASQLAAAAAVQRASHDAAARRGRLQFETSVARQASLGVGAGGGSGGAEGEPRTQGERGSSGDGSCPVASYGRLSVESAAAAMSRRGVESRRRATGRRSVDSSLDAAAVFVQPLVASHFGVAAAAGGGGSCHRNAAGIPSLVPLSPLSPYQPLQPQQLEQPEMQPPQSPPIRARHQSHGNLPLPPPGILVASAGAGGGAGAGAAAAAAGAAGAAASGGASPGGGEYEEDFEVTSALGERGKGKGEECCPPLHSLCCCHPAAAAPVPSCAALRPCCFDCTRPM